MTQASVADMLGTWGHAGMHGQTVTIVDGPSPKPLPPYERPPHTTASLLHRVGLRALHGHSALRSGRRMLPAEALAGNLHHHQTARGHQFAVYCVSFDKSGRYLATGSDDMYVKVQLAFLLGYTCSLATTADSWANNSKTSALVAPRSDSVGPESADSVPEI